MVLSMCKHSFQNISTRLCDWILLSVLHCMQGSWKLSLRNSFKNFRRDRPVDAENERPVSRKRTMSVSEAPSKRLNMSTEGSREITDEEYEDAMTELNTEYKMSKRGRNHATIKHLMETTQQRRRKWIMEESPHVSEVLDKFPFLTSSKNVSCLLGMMKVIGLHVTAVVAQLICLIIKLHTILQLRREFRGIAGIEGRATSLMGSWPNWMLRILEFSKLEAVTRLAIRKLVQNYQADTDVENPTGLHVLICKTCLLFYIHT